MIRWLSVRLVNFAQGLADKVYAEKGLTDELFDLQLRINYLRNKHNLIKEEDYVQ